MYLVAFTPRLMELDAQDRRGGRLLAAPAWLPGVEHRVVVEIELRRRPRAAAQGIDRAVADDPQHPGANAPARGVEAGGAPPDGEKGLLGDVLRHARLAHDPVGERV